MASVDANTITYDAVLRDHNWQAYNQSSNYAPSGYLLCYCQQIDYELGSEALKSYDFFNVQTGTNERWCSDLADGGNYAQLATYGATAIIIIINVCLHQFLKFITTYECHTSDTHEVISIAVKIMFSQYINTGLLSLIIYGNLSTMNVKKTVLGQTGNVSFGIFTGTFTDLSTAWYAAVGSSLLFTMFVFIVGSQLLTVLRITYKRCQQKLDQFSGITTTYPYLLFNTGITRKELQVDLDLLYIKIEFPFDRQLATMGTLVLVTLTYSSTLPLMNIICFISLCIFYAANKVLIYCMYTVHNLLHTNVLIYYY
jgi:hypothetical protein